MLNREDELAADSEIDQPLDNSTFLGFKGNATTSFIYGCLAIVLSIALMLQFHISSARITVLQGSITTLQTTITELQNVIAVKSELTATINHMNDRETGVIMASASVASSEFDFETYRFRLTGESTIELRDGETPIAGERLERIISSMNDCLESIAAKIRNQK